MEKLIEIVVGLIDFMILGVIALATLAYLVALFNPLGRTLTSYVNRLSKLVLDTDFDKWFKIGLALGLIYYAGVLANSTSYWALSPVHDEIIKKVENPVVGKDEQVDADPNHLWFVQLPRHSPSALEFKAYSDYLTKEVAWQNKDLEAAKHALDPLHRDIRIVRGTVFFALCITLIAMLKGVSSIVISVISFLSCAFKCSWWRNTVCFFYREMIDDDYQFLDQIVKQKSLEGVCN